LAYQTWGKGVKPAFSCVARAGDHVVLVSASSASKTRQVHAEKPNHAEIRAADEPGTCAARV
jgi:hypothetical protein